MVVRLLSFVYTPVTSNAQANLPREPGFGSGREAELFVHLERGGGSNSYMADTQHQSQCCFCQSYVKKTKQKKNRSDVVC